MSAVLRSRPGRVCCLVVAVLASLAGIGVAPAGATVIPIVFEALPATQYQASQLGIGILSPTPVNSMTIHLYSGDTDVLDLPMSDFTALDAFSESAGQEFDLTDPATALASLPLGTYTATGDATDTGGDSVTGEAIPGTFPYVALTTVTIGPATSYTTYPGEQITLSGQLDMQAPLSTTPSGFGGQPVTVELIGGSSSSGDSWTATTAADGSYSVQVPATPGNVYAGYFNGTPGSLSAYSGEYDLATDDAQLAATQLTATVTPALTVYGQTQTVSGTLTYQSGSQSLPAPPGVTITVTAASDSQSVTAVTQSGGTFSAALPTVPGATTWLVSSAEDLNSNPFLQSAQTQASGSVLLPTAITGFSAKLSKYGIITITGCLTSTAAGYAFSGYPSVQIQFTESPGGPWRNLGTVATGQLSGCSGAGIDAEGPAPSNYAYYRASFAGDSSFEPATSSASLAWLYATRFSSFRVSPRSDNYGQKFTISGALQYYFSRWHGYAGQRVQIVFSLNKKTLYSYGWLKTSRTGTFRTKVTDRYRTGYWAVVYWGSNTHLAVITAFVKVTTHDSHAVASALPGSLAPSEPFGPLGPAAVRPGREPLVSLLASAGPDPGVRWTQLFS
jgi:hypothetical protein